MVSAALSADGGNRLLADASCPAPTPTLKNALRLYPRVTPPPTPCTVNQVVIHLSTTVVISDYSRYFAPTPIASFRPSYLTLGDGSLVANPFFEDLRDANVSLLVTGMLTMLFMRNVIVSADYLRRGGIKKKTLFYWLLFSQLLAPLCFIPDILGYFTTSVNCMAVLCISRMASSISLSILITGILGYKAYRCLESSKIVLAGLIIFTTASAVFTILDVLGMHGVRRLSGGCNRTSELRYMQYYAMVQFLESLFVCLSFVYAVRRSHGLPAARGRISLELSTDDPPTDKSEPPNNWQVQVRRGWWDYVPNSEKPISPSQPPPPTGGQKYFPLPELLVNLRPQRPRAGSEANLLGVASTAASPSLKTLRPLAVKISQPNAPRNPPSSERLPPDGRSSPAPSSLSRISKFMPRMVLFRTVMKDELFYTAFITATCVVVAVLAIIGLNFHNGLSVNGWILLNWAFISVLAIHSFGRVVRRNERDALLHHPSMWDSALSADKATAEAYGQSRFRRPWTPVSVASHRRQRQVSPTQEFEDKDNHEDPFADPRHRQPSVHSWNSAFAAVSELRSPSPTYSVSSLTREPLQSDHVILPSLGDDFPTSGRTTPVVPHDGSDGTLLQDLQNAIWLEPRIRDISENQADSDSNGTKLT